MMMIITAIANVLSVIIRIFGVDVLIEIFGRIGKYYVTSTKTKFDDRLYAVVMAALRGRNYLIELYNNAHNDPAARMRMIAEALLIVDQGFREGDELMALTDVEDPTIYDLVTSGVDVWLSKQTDTTEVPEVVTALLIKSITQQVAANQK